MDDTEIACNALHTQRYIDIFEQSETWLYYEIKSEWAANNYVVVNNDSIFILMLYANFFRLNNLLNFLRPLIHNWRQANQTLQPPQPPQLRIPPPPNYYPCGVESYLWLNFYTSSH